MSKHLKLFSALLVLMVLAPISVFVFPSNAEAARSLVRIPGVMRMDNWSQRMLLPKKME